VASTLIHGASIRTAAAIDLASRIRTLLIVPGGLTRTFPQGSKVAYHAIHLGERVPNKVAVIVWRDMLVLCDDGRSVASDYAELSEIAQELHRRCADGWGMLIIIPPNAVPPSEPVRRAIDESLCNLQHLRGASWAIEGSGFQGAMVRAVLTGMRFLIRAPYPRNVSTCVEESLSWLLPLLPGGEKRLDDAEELASYILTRRDALTRFQSVIRSTANKVASRAE
jgi:hypothetical protein